MIKFSEQAKEVMQLYWQAIKNRPSQFALTFILSSFILFTLQNFKVSDGIELSFHQDTILSSMALIVSFVSEFLFAGILIALLVTAFYEKSGHFHVIDDFMKVIKSADFRWVPQTVFYYVCIITVMTVFTLILGPGDSMPEPSEGGKASTLGAFVLIFMMLNLFFGITLYMYYFFTVKVFFCLAGVKDKIFYISEDEMKLREYGEVFTSTGIAHCIGATLLTFILGIFTELGIEYVFTVMTVSWLFTISAVIRHSSGDRPKVKETADDKVDNMVFNT